MAWLPNLPNDRLRAVHIGGYWRGPTDTVRQMLLGLQRTGATVLEYCTDRHPEALDTAGRPYDRGRYGPVWLRWEVLAEQIESFAPHLIVCNAGGLSFPPEVAAQLRRRYCLLGTAGSDPDVFEPSTSRISPCFDFFLTTHVPSVSRHRALGARAGVLPLATDEEMFRPLPPRPELSCEVLIMGRAHPDRIDPVRALHERFDTHIYGEGWQEHGLPSRGLLEGEDVVAALCSAKIVPVFFRTPCGDRLVKPPLFDFLAAGTLVITNYFAEVERYFVFDKEIAGFDSTEELLDKVRSLLDNPGEAEAMRRAGRQRVLREHTWPKVWSAILDSLRSGTVEIGTTSSPRDSDAPETEPTGDSPSSGLRRLDLGCGNQVRPGFIGLDRFPLAGAHVVADMNAPHLPFADDQFDLILSVHALEHVENLPQVMREIWRIGRPGAQVALVVPYGASPLNLANPYHLQHCNEHTPRFWTDAPSSPIDPAEWVEPPLTPHWGIASSDNHDPGLDLRCLRMEFFYLQEYWHLSPARLRRARKLSLNVCEQIMYHLVVFKPPVTEEDVAALASNLDPYVPEYSQARRAARQRWEQARRLPRWLRRLLGRS